MVAVVSLYRGLEAFELRCEMLHLYNSGAGSRDSSGVLERPDTDQVAVLPQDKECGIGRCFLASR